eukprot:COSAG01_NODE_26474_length_713_cov_0.433225_2_plen_49_part_01
MLDRPRPGNNALQVVLRNDERSHEQEAPAGARINSMRGGGCPLQIRTAT